MAFTPSQQAAVDFDGHLLMVSGPGSGKTTVSVARALRILSDPSRSLIMVTFTREGADEMSRRIGAKCLELGIPGYNKSRLMIGTFHSIAIDHIFRHKSRIPTLSPAQQSMYLRDAIGPNLAADRELVDQIRKEFEYYMYSVNRDGPEMLPETTTVIERYKLMLKHAKVTDLYAVMRGCAMQVDSQKIPPLPYTDMIVDESQDTDDIQRMWIFAHARSGIQTALVGDDDQSIYEWRHALGYSGMKHFMDEFGAKRIELSSNFRCREEILGSAVSLVALNHKRLDKNLVAERGSGGRILSYLSHESVFAESLARFILKLPSAHTDCAVLARTNFALDNVELELTKAGIEYIRLGKSIWDNPLVQTYLVLMQTLVDENPSGIYAAMSFIGLRDDFKSTVLAAMNGSATQLLSGLTPKSLSTDEFAEDLIHLKALAKSCAYWRGQLASSGSVNEVVLDVAQFLASKTTKRKQKSLLEYCGVLLTKFSGTLSKRLMAISRSSSKKDAAPVKLMTMHASKGQEFQTVHIIEANAPDITAGAPINGDEIEAERRLMYVAITRAKDNCMVWYTASPHSTVSEAKIPPVYGLDAAIEAFGGTG